MFFYNTYCLVFAKGGWGCGSWMREDFDDLKKNRRQFNFAFNTNISVVKEPSKGYFELN